MKVVATRNVFVAGLGHVEAGQTITVNDDVAADLFLAAAARPQDVADKGKASRIMDATMVKAYRAPAPHHRGRFARRLVRARHGGFARRWL